MYTLDTNILAFMGRHEHYRFIARTYEKSHKSKLRLSVERGPLVPNSEERSLLAGLRNGATGHLLLEGQNKTSSKQSQLEKL